MTERPIAREWSCQQSGDCCRATPAVVMTTQERALILAHPAARGRSLIWDKQPASPFWAMKAGPCPLLDGSHCSVYGVRPYNCRRFGCFRPNPRVEPYEATGMFGCQNFEDRLRLSRIVRRAAKAMQVKAMRWAAQHGWRS